MLEKEITRIFLKEFQSLYPVTSIRQQLKSKERGVGMLLDVHIPDQKVAKRIACEVIAEGFPRYIRIASRQLKLVCEKSKSLYPVIIAPFISEDGRKICKEEGVGFFDLSGNSFLALPGTYIETKGNPNRYPAERKLKSVFKGKSSRIPRIMLLNTNRLWTMRELANEASLSVGQVFKVITRLEELDVLMRTDQTAIQLNKPAALLDLWRAEYSYTFNEQFEYYSLSAIPEIEKSIAEECQRQNIRYALAMFSGAARIAPFTRYTKAFVYVDDPSAIIEKLNLRKVESGSNVVLLKPYDDGVYYGLQNKDRLSITSTIQLYVDLFGYKGRGEEQAEFLRSQVVKF
jgi:hypothetical protein